MNKENKKSFITRLILFFICLLTVIIGLLLYSRYIATRGLVVKEYRIVNEKITNNFHGLKIIHISDIHYGRTINDEYLESLVSKINYINPDIVFLTGDLIDKDTKLTNKQSEKLSKFLNKIDAKIGKYAIMGDHDYKFDNWKFIIEDGGFTNLNDTYDLIYKNDNNYIILNGMSTNIYGNLKPTDKLVNINNYLNSIDTESQKNIYKILIMHEPDFIDDFDYKQFDLILAGHTHNGQIRLPILGAIILSPYGEKYYDNYYNLGETELYISSGIGVSNINFRFLNKPSINFYRLTHE